jgi:NAD(P)-dependent dehydrogenase (short-subunit alcohol dehydrogenase family)
MEKVVLVTGGSRGIGAATAILAAEAGYHVAVNYRSDGPAAERVVGQIEARGRRAMAIQADVGAPEQIAPLFEAVDTEFGRLDVLVNNAGIAPSVSRVDEMNAERIERTLRINVVGSMLCAREAVRRMSKRHGGRGGAIVNVSSAAARLGSPGEFVDYAASKGAIDSFTLGLAREVADEGIRVNAVRPGLIDTDIHESAGMPDRVDRMAPGVPLKRAGTAEEVAEALVWLISDRSSYVTGALLDVSGGR